jgi:hypothetical protein
MPLLDITEDFRVPVKILNSRSARPNADKTPTILVLSAVFWCSLQYSGALCSVLVLSAVFWCSLQCSGALCSILVLSAVFWCSLQCSGALCSVMALCAVFWCSLQCSGALCSALVLSVVFWWSLQCSSAYADNRRRSTSVKIRVLRSKSFPLYPSLVTLPFVGV